MSISNVLTASANTDSQSFNSSHEEKSIVEAKTIDAGLLEYFGRCDFHDMLPQTLLLDGKPMNVSTRRPMFKPLFEKNRRAKKNVFICGRQLGKTASIAASTLMNLIWREYFRILYVAPLAIFTHRFHHMYMSQMIQRCLVKRPPIQDHECVCNVNEKTFTTGSHFHAASCYNSAANALGIAADALYCDEVQDLDIDFLPQITETLGTSDYRWESYFGTARGMEGTLQALFDQSCQYEWTMKCGCGEWIIPTMDHHALTMIQPHGIACPKCSTLLDVNLGEWVAKFPDRCGTFDGYHIPQTIVKDRITPHDRYLNLYNKLHGVGRYSLARFQQEVLGISSDQGGKPVTLDDIKKVCTLDISPEKPANPGHYVNLCGGVDWGGSEITSFTVGTVIGWHPGGEFHCIGAIRPTGVPDNERHIPIAAYLRKISSGRLVAIGADAGFVGSVQNKNLEKVSAIQTGSISYGSLKNLYRALPLNQFVVDRTTIIYIVLALIKEKKLFFPKGQWFETFLSDLLAIYVDEYETPNGSQMRRYHRYKTQADDFLHALCYAIFMCSVTASIPVTSLVGLAANASLSKSALDELGEEGKMTNDPSNFMQGRR
jgi:hypothetical protein